MIDRESKTDDIIHPPFDNSKWPDEWEGEGDVATSRYTPHQPNQSD